MKKVLIAGGTGLIGSRLSYLLTQSGYEVAHLSRKIGGNPQYPTYHWDPMKGVIDQDIVSQVDYVINLAGAGIADARWTAARKKLIIDSRVKGNELLLSAFQELSDPPKAYISSAAIGYYGDRGEQEISEEDGPGIGFLSESCVAWEKSIEQIRNKTKIRTVAIRIGIVMSTQGGALEKMLLPLLAYTSTYFGNGQQWYSWIHIEDICRQFIFALENEKMEGVYNGVAPNPARNKTIAKVLPKAKGITAAVVPAPSLALRLAMGEMADAVLTGTKISAAKIQAAGFQFEHPYLEEALRHLISNKL
ncbi:MAG: TIGR01777 family protein [Saprospiraceae bacterium]|nr:TIGR01777 family protein [Saprospiraceae bacterium]